MGKKRLLRKCEKRGFPTVIRTVNVHGDRLVVGDMQQSYHFLRYNRERNELSLFADDTTPRYVTCSAMLDYDTIAGADKFGNVFVLRLPDGANDDAAVGAGVGGANSLWESNPA